MLQAIRDRAHGIMAWVMLIVIGVPFTLWGIQNYLDSAKERPAAVVGDREIFDREVSRAYEQSLANLVGLAEVNEKQLKHDTLERLIRDEVILHAAESRKFAISDEDVRGFVQMLPYFQTDGKFDKDKYQGMLSAQGMAPTQFIAQVKRALLLEQFQRGLVDSSFVARDQIQTLIRLKNEEREIEYINIPVKSGDRAYSDAEISTYYQEHLPDFQNPERVSIAYVSISLDELASQIKPTEEELRLLYEEQKANFGTEERRKVSHILVPVDGSGEEADKLAQTKINQLHDRLDKGEDFVMLAKEASGDPVSAKNGGDLGYITKGGMDPNFATAAFALKMGEVSAPVKTSFGYHLIKVTELVPASIKSFDEVKPELQKMFQHNAAESKFYDLGQTLTELSYEHPDSLAPAAEKLGLKIQQTSLFTRDSSEGLAAEPKIMAAAFSEDVLNGKNSDPIELDDQKAVVLRVVEHQPALDKSLAEVRDAILARMRTEEASKFAHRTAEDILKQVQGGKPFSEIAQGAGLSIVKLPALRRETSDVPRALVEAVFAVPSPQYGLSPSGIVEIDNVQVAVFTVLARKDGVTPAQAKEGEERSAREFLAKNLGQREFSAFVAQLRSHADVTIYSDN